ncbi:E3 SUMO-protein ligase ZBED1-like [Pagrus major]|uniref:E3 SUMO-protein ligase ZBED1-like n=1 Tax=Pagrus major TaxID=143350 RepID=UPI003CC88E22
MATVGSDFDVEDAQRGLKSPVWQHFGFPIYSKTTGEKWTDKTKTACKYCRRLLPYNGNTSNMQQHISRHHSEKQSELTPPQRKLPRGQTTLTGGFAAPLHHHNARAQEITKAIGYFIGKDLRPFSVVENEGFRLLMNTLEPRYRIPSRQHFSQVVVPKLYQEVRAHVVEILREADTVSITTDGWTSRATQSYITITAHVINAEWELAGFVLQTRPLLESHTGANIAEVLKEAVAEWQLERQQQSIAVVTDNARNMDVAVREAGLAPHIKCFAHTLNLATQAGLSVPRISRLLGRIRRIVNFFHRSPTATAVLAAKQKLLLGPDINEHKLIVDVTTRWNSSLDMLQRYLDLQPAVAAALLSPEVRRNAREIDTLDNLDIRDAEDIMKLLKPLKTVTTVLSDEQNPTVSLIVPLKHTIEQSMLPVEEDSTTVSTMKKAIFNNLSDRYTGPGDNHLLDCTALDPRFRSLPHLTEDQRQDVFQRVKEKAVQMYKQTNSPVEETGGVTDTSASTHAAELPADQADMVDADLQQPTHKKTALEDLLAGTFTENVGTAQGNHMCGIEAELVRYRSEMSISLTSCPLKWWKENSKFYPLLSPLAKAYLTTPATSVPSERVFSTAGDVVTSQRSQLRPENVDMLIFLKRNLKV